MGLVACASVWLFVQHAVYKPIRDAEISAGGDFLAFYMAGYRLPLGEDIYDLPAMKKQAGAMGMKKGPPAFPYPPLSAVPFIPLAHTLPPIEAFQFTVFMYTILYWLSLPLLFNAFKLPFTWNSVCTGIILFSIYTPSWTTVDTGQVNMVVFFFVSAGLFFLVRRRDTIFGIAFGIAAVAKLFPGIAVFEMLFQRRFRALCGVALVGILMVIISIGLGGTDQYERYVKRDMKDNIKTVHAGRFDVSMKSFIHRLCIHNDAIRGSGRLFRLTNLYSRYAGYVLLIGTFLILLFGARNLAHMPLRICFLLTLLLIISPWTWTHHLVMALPCLTAVTSYARGLRGKARIAVFAGITVSYICMAIGYRYHIAVRPGQLGRELINTSSVNFYGVVILFVLISYLIIHFRKKDETTAD